jgi:hypothetical protein
MQGGMKASQVLVEHHHGLRVHLRFLLLTTT